VHEYINIYICIHIVCRKRYWLCCQDRRGSRKGRYIYVYLYTCIYIYVYIYIYKYMYIYLYIYMYICCIHVCICICIYMYVHVCIYVYTTKEEVVDTYIYVCIHIYICIHVHMCKILYGRNIKNDNLCTGLFVEYCSVYNWFKTDSSL
jgi:hypothetical protein